MATDRNIQNSFGPEVAHHEYLPNSAPTYVNSQPDSGLYVVDYSKAAQLNAATAPEVAGEKTPRKRICGLTVPILITLVVAAIAVLGVGIGVGVGVGLNNSNKGAASPDSTPQPTTPLTVTPPESENEGEGEGNEDDTDPPRPSVTDAATTDGRTSEKPTSTSSAPVTSGTVGLSDNSCTFTTPRTYTSSDGTHFLQICFTDWPNNSEAADGEGRVEDLRRLTLYTFEDCMEACLDYNDSLDEGDTRCRAITYNSNLTSIIAVGRQGGNCFLKNKQGVDRAGSAESACAVIV